MKCQEPNTAGLSGSSDHPPHTNQDASPSTILDDLSRAPTLVAPAARQEASTKKAGYNKPGFCPRSLIFGHSKLSVPQWPSPPTYCFTAYSLLLSVLRPLISDLRPPSAPRRLPSVLCLPRRSLKSEDGSSAFRLLPTATTP